MFRIVEATTEVCDGAARWDTLAVVHSEWTDESPMKLIEKVERWL